MNTQAPCARAAYLRDAAKRLPFPLATAYKRRAAELELEAHIVGAFAPVAKAA